MLVLRSGARYHQVKKPREKITSTKLDSTATTIYTASANIWIEEAEVKFANIDSNKTQQSLYLRDTTGSVAVDGNAVVKNAVVPGKAHGKKDLGGFGDDQVVEGHSSGNLIVATLIGRKIDRT